MTVVTLLFFFNNALIMGVFIRWHSLLGLWNKKSIDEELEY